MYVCR